VLTHPLSRKLGFIHEATFHHRLEISPGDFRNLMLWSFFEETYPSSYAAQSEIQAFDAIGRRIF
jgi:hypothetical protein